MTLAIDKMNGHGHINTAHHEWLPKKYGDTVLATKGLPERRSASFIKVRGWRCSDAIKEAQLSASQ